VALLLRSLSVDDGDRVVDLAAGRGRLAGPLAAGGLRVTALDYSIDGIAHLARHRGVATVRGDMRRLPFRSCFRGGYCMGNSFGYFDLPGVETFLRETARILNHGARFILESATVAESLLPSLAAETFHEFGGVEVIGRHHHEPDRDRVVSTLETRVGNRRTTQVISQLALPVDRIAALLTASGFDVEHLLGDTDGTAYEAGAGSLIVVARKRPVDRHPS
jgi:SAM-dependent methyltransferase